MPAFHALKSLSIRMKLYVPIGLVLALVVASVAVLLVTKQNRDSEQAFRNNLESLAISSRLMIHSAAEQYARSKGLEFQRLSSLESTAAVDTSAPVGKALALFRSDPQREILVDERGVGDDTRMFVHVPVRIQDECRFCHNPQGVEIFGDRPTGTLVAAFGVSGSTKELRAQQSQTIVVTVGLGIAAIFVIVLVLQFLTGNLIFRPLDEVIMQLNLVARGDLRPVDTPALQKKMDWTDEMGRLANSFSATMGELRHIVTSVRSLVLEVSAESDNVAAKAEQMSAGGEEQTSQTSEVASAIEQMARTIVENSRNASTASETAKRARSAAEQGGKVVEETITGMQSIAAVVKQSAQTVHELGKSSDQIGEIISVIDDIADQTNLLALNAAIEAARAGEHGRGFAVVADEVRKLAERTTRATKEIAEMIKKIQVDTKGAVLSMEQGTAKVDEGIRKADRAGESLKEIVKISEEVTDMVTQIAAASEQQSSAGEQITRNVEAINNVTNDVAVGIQGIASSTESLRHLTGKLQEAIARFKLEDVEGGSTLSTKAQPSQGRSKKWNTPVSKVAVKKNGALVEREA